MQSGVGSSVSIATGHGLDGPGIESRWGEIFSHLSRPDLEPSQPPVQWAPGLSQGVKSGQGVTLTLHLLLVLWSRKSIAIPLLPLWAVRPVQSLSASTRAHFIFTFFIHDSVINHQRHVSAIKATFWLNTKSYRKYMLKFDEC